MKSQPLPARTLLAICERHGYRRDRAGDLSRDYVMAVLLHETDDRGGLVIAVPDTVPRTAEQATRERLRRWKVPEWLIEREVARAPA